MTDLTDFLLARIAEDRARQIDWAGSWHATDCRSNLTDGAQPCCGAPARILRECDAKQRLIERVGNPDWAGFQFLALPYADHPDYQQAWRP